METLEGIAIRMPMMISKLILTVVPPQRFYWALGISSAFSVVAFSFLAKFLQTASQIKDMAIGKALIPAIPLIYGGYLILTLPVFLLFAFLKDGNFGKTVNRDKRFVFSVRQMQAARKKVPRNEVFLGRSMKTKRSISLSNEMRKMHTHVVGSTGSGKTDSLILPLLVQDIQCGRGALVMDAKGDRETLNKIFFHIKRAGREKDFLFFSLAYPERSNTYNPLLRGNPTELKDKIISANIWTEEFYKKKSEETLLLLMKSLREAKEEVTFQKLYDLLSNEKKLTDLAKRLRDPHLKDLMINILNKYAVFQKDLAGLTADLGMIAESEFSSLLLQETPQIDLLNAYLNKQIVYFQLNAQGYEETARRFGRIVLQDLKTISNHIQAYLPEEQRAFFPIYVDEFSNFAYEPFIEFLNKARGAHLGITIAHQSLGDLEKTGSHFMKQVLENCNIKVVLRQDDPDSIETYARISGTEKALKDTLQTQEDFLDKTPTGLGTVREVDEFRLKPNVIRELGRGEAGIIIKQPFMTDVLQLDFIGQIPQQNYVA